VNKFGSQRTTHNGGTRSLQFEWDGDEIFEIVMSGVDRALSIVEAKGAAFVFSGFDTVTPIQCLMRKHGLIPKPFAWVKEYPPPPAPGTWWPSAFESAVYGYKSGAFFGDKDIRRSNVVKTDTYRHGQTGKIDHPTQKWLPLMNYIVKSVAPPSGVCLDPFMGSGTTGVAAIQLGRKFIGIEIDPTYFEIACRRIRDVEGYSTLFDPALMSDSLFPEVLPQ
jgi:DNA modification methylase